MARAKKPPTKKSKRGKKPAPSCKVLLLCDQVIQDARTGKQSLIGVFDTVAFPSYPAGLPPFFAFAQLVDGIGEYKFSIEIHDLREDKVIARIDPPPITFGDRTNRTNVVLVLGGLALPHHGKYDFTILADGDPIGRQMLVALTQGEVQNERNPDDDDEK